MRAAILFTALVLTGCGPSSTTVTKEGKAVTTTSLGGGAVVGTTDCATKPDFVPIYAGAAIQVCSSAHFEATGKDGGSIIYLTDAAPATVLAWAKQETAKAGLAEKLSIDKMFSAGDGNKRTIMVHAEAKGGTTHVVTNWGKTP